MNYCVACGIKLEQRVVSNRTRFYCPCCQAYRYQNPMAAVAGIVLNEEKQVLLVRRAKGQTYAGTWCIPCGHIEWGEDIRTALVRELHEETGLDVADFVIYEVLSNFHDPKQLSVGCWFLCHSFSGVLASGDDADLVGWYSYEHLPSLAFDTDRVVLNRLYQEGKLI